MIGKICVIAVFYSEHSQCFADTNDQCCHGNLFIYLFHSFSSFNLIAFLKLSRRGGFMLAFIVSGCNGWDWGIRK